MPVSLSIKNVPDEIAERLRRRAARAHRSLQGELLTIIEQAVEEVARPARPRRQRRRLDPGLDRPAGAGRRPHRARDHR